MAFDQQVRRRVQGVLKPRHEISRAHDRLDKLIARFDGVHGEPGGVVGHVARRDPQEHLPGGGDPLLGAAAGVRDQPEVEPSRASLKLLSSMTAWVA